MPLLADVAGLDDFWSDAPFVDAAATAEPAVAARAATQVVATEAADAASEADTTADAATPSPAAPSPLLRAGAEQLEALVHELRQLRREHARQNRALMVLACLFVALLLSYLDRLRAGQRLTSAAAPRPAALGASAW